MWSVATTFSKTERIHTSNGSAHESSWNTSNRMLDDISELHQQQGCSQNIPQIVSEKQSTKPEVKNETEQLIGDSSTKTPENTVKLRITAKAKQHLPPECISDGKSTSRTKDSSSPSGLDFPQKFRRPRLLPLDSESSSEVNDEVFSMSYDEASTSSDKWEGTAWKRKRRLASSDSSSSESEVLSLAETEGTPGVEVSVNVENSMHVRIMQKLINDVSLCGTERNYLKNLLAYSKKNTWNRGVDEMTMTDYYDEIAYYETKKIEWCNREIMRDNPDVGRIRLLMDVSFPWRRDQIISSCPEISRLLNRFSIFKNEKQLREEFERITNPYVHSKYLEQIGKYCKLMIKYAPKSDLRHEIKSMLRFHRAAGNDDRYVRVAGVVLLMPSYFGENVYDFIAFETTVPIAEYPHIICSSSVKEAVHGLSSFSIYADGIQLYEQKHLPEAFFTLLAVYNVFNIDYPNYVLEAATLTEVLLLEIAPCFKETKKVIKVRRFLERKQLCETVSS